MSRIRASAYTRVSLDEQARDGVSLASQQDRIAAYCQAQDWDLVEVYVDPGYSGKNLNRPALQRALADAKAGRFDVLLVWRLDRLSRRQRDVLHVVEDLLGAYGVGLRSITESFDTTTPAGKAMLGMLSVFAQLERETLQERTRAGKEQAAKQGRRLGSPPYGYRIENGLLIPQEPAASFVRALYARYLAGAGIQKLTEWANEASGCKPKSGKAWHYNHLRIVLTNATYAGLQPHLGNAYPAQHEPLVSLEDFEAVQRTLDTRRETKMAQVRSADYLLSGLRPRCGLCGAPIHGTRSPANWPRKPRKWNRYYVCSHVLSPRRGAPDGDRCTLPYRRKDDVEADVRDALRQLAWDEDMLRERLDRTAAAREAKEAERGRRAAALRIELTDLDRRLQRWYDAFEGGALTPADLSGRTGELRERKVAVEAALAALAEPEPEPRDDEAEGMLAQLRDMAATMEDIERADLREFLRIAATAIIVYPDHVDVQLIGIG